MARGGPDEIDRRVGRRVMEMRKSLAMSQERLGDALGVSFQQVQKYEKGTNRVSASRLRQIAGALGVPVTYFYEGIDDGAEAQGAAVIGLPAMRDDRRGLSDESLIRLGAGGRIVPQAAEIEALVAAFRGVPVPAIREGIVAHVRMLARTLSGDDGLCGEPVDGPRSASGTAIRGVRSA
jgi:transcriptional regulator with XRE-family HTH domain